MPPIAVVSDEEAARVALEEPGPPSTYSSRPSVIGHTMFEEGPTATLDLSPGRLPIQRPDSQWPNAVWPWMGALPWRQAIIAAKTALALSDSPDGAYQLGDAIRRARRLGGADRLCWEKVSYVVSLAVRDAVPFPRRRRGEPPVDLVAQNRRRTAWYQRWWDTVKRRLAIADVATANIAFRRVPRSKIVRPQIVGTRNPQVVGAAKRRRRPKPIRPPVTVGGQSQIAWWDIDPFPRTKAALPLEAFERGPVTKRPDEWAAWPWVAALPLESAVVAAETALGLLVPVENSWANMARASIGSIRTMVAQASPDFAFESGEVLERRQRVQLAHTAWRSIARLIWRAVEATTAWELVREYAIDDYPLIGVNVRSVWYARWWSLVKQRLALANVATAQIEFKDVDPMHVVRPQIVGAPPPQYEPLRSGLQHGKRSVLPWSEYRELLRGPSRPAATDLSAAVERELQHHSAHAIYRAQPVYESFFKKIWQLVPLSFKQSVIACDTAIQLVTPLIYQVAADLLDPDSPIRRHAWSWLQEQYTDQDWENTSERVQWWADFVAGPPGTESVYQRLLAMFMKKLVIIDRGWPLPVGEYNRFVSETPLDVSNELLTAQHFLEREGASITYPTIAGTYYPGAVRRIIRVMESMASSRPWLPTLTIAELIGDYCARVAFYGFGFLQDIEWGQREHLVSLRIPDSHSLEFWEIFGRWVRIWAQAVERRLAVADALTAQFVT